EAMLPAIALKTGTGPGTILGGYTADNTSHAASRDAIDRTLGSVVIADEVRRYNFKNAVADDVVDEFQVVVLQRDLIGIPVLDQVGLHFFAKQLALCRILDVDRRGIFIPHFGVSVNVFQRALVGLKVIPNDVLVCRGELFVGGNRNVRGRAAALVGF